MKRRLLSLTLTFLMISSLLFSLPMTSYAATKEIEGINILAYDGVVSSIETSIPTRSSTYHPAEKLIDSSLTGDNYFKTDNTKDRNKDLVVTFNLSSIHKINAVTIYERFMNQTCTDSVKIEIGTSSSMKVAGENLALSSGGTGVAKASHFTFDRDYEGDIIKITFKGGKIGKPSSDSQYEIYEIEAYEEVKIDGNILASHTSSVTASISPSNATVHAPEKMVDGSFSGDDYYKSANSKDDNTDLVVTIKLDIICPIGQIKIFERYLSSYGVCSDEVSVRIGTGTDLTEVISGQSLEALDVTGVSDTVLNVVPQAFGDTIEITFKGTEDRGTQGECTYQIYEIEAYTAAESEVYMYAGSPRARVDGYVRIIDDDNINVVPEFSDSVFMVPVDFFANALKLEYSGNENTATVKSGDKTVTFTSGDGSYTKYGHLYVSATDFCDALNIGYENDSCGLFFAGNFAEVDWNSRAQFSDITRKLREVVYGAIPLPSDVLVKLKSQNPENDHPRLFLNENFDVEDLRERVKHNPYKLWASTVISYADSNISELAQDPIEYEIPDGIRLLSVSERVMKYVQNIAFAYLLTGETKYSDKVTDILMTVCTFPDWNEKHFLDVGKMSAAVALGYDWCYDKLSDSQKSIIKTALVEFALKPVMKDYNEEERNRTYHWSSKSTGAYPNNWIAVCVGGTTMAALAIGDEDLGDFTDAGKVITEGMDRLKDLLDSYLPDGGFLDGYSYWRFAMEYIGNYVACMNSALGTDYNISKAPGLSVTFEWVQQLTGPAGPFNFDTCGSAFMDSPEFTLFGYLTGKSAYVDFRINDQLGANFIAPHFKDIIWYDSSISHTDAKLPYEYISRGATNVYVTKGGNGKNDSWAAMYVGYRKKAVGAMQDFDGTFVLDMLGNRWAIDYGGESQTYYNTGNSFCDYYICRAEGHNTIILTEGDDHDHDPYACGKLLRNDSNDISAYAVYDFTDQLDDKGASLWHRGMKIDRISQKVTVQDRIEIADGDSMFYWFMHTGAEIEISEDGKTATLSQWGKQIQARLISDDSSLVFTEMAADPLPGSPNPEIQQTREGTRKLAIHSDSISKVNIAVEFVPLTDGTTNVKTDVLTDMNSWTLKNSSGVILNNVGTGAYGAGEYAPGETVTVYAGQRTDTTFSHWEAEGITLSDPTNPVQTFTASSGIVKLTARWKGRNFIDVNFDNWTYGAHNLDSLGSPIAISWAGKRQTNSVVQVPEKDGKVLKIPVGTTSDQNYYVRARFLSGSLPRTYETCEVLWTEFSIKYEGGFAGFGFGENTSATGLININKNGEIEKFTKWGYGEVGGGNYTPGQSIGDETLELGKWYHFVIALDFADKKAQSNGAPLYVWLNGELIENGGTYAGMNPSAAWEYHKMWIDTAESEGRTVYIDNLRLYETTTVDNHAVEEFAQTAIPEDSYYEETGRVYVKRGTKVSEISEIVSPLKVKLIKDGRLLSDTDIVLSGSTLFLNSDNGRAYSSYEVITDFECSLVRESLTQTGDTFSIDCINNSGNAIDAEILVAVYDDTELKEVTIPKKVTIPKGRSKITGIDNSIASSGEEYKVFIWQDSKNLKPLSGVNIFAKS
ncbi:MAG: hypothetical protein E7394_07080 [Ruminococcaceae bacterium]|nr:hypothetical protein [Oscillospiraceae bacterium]